LNCVGALKEKVKINRQFNINEIIRRIKLDQPYTKQTINHIEQLSMLILTDSKK